MLPNDKHETVVHVVNHSGDPEEAVGNPFFDSHCEDGKCDFGPTVPIRRYSEQASALEVKAAYFSELIHLDEFGEEEDLDSKSYASTVSDITNPTLCSWSDVERSTSGHRSESDYLRQEVALPKDMPPRPAAREVTRESQRYADEQSDRGVLSPPPPTPSPRPFSGEILVPSEVSQKIPAERPKYNDNDTPPRPFPRRPTETSFVPPSPLGDNHSLQDQPMDEKCPPNAHSRPMALMKIAKEFVSGVHVGTHFYHLKKYENTFVGQDAVDFMVEANLAYSREDAVFLGQRLLKELTLFHHVHWDHNFKDGRFFYRFTENESCSIDQHCFSCLDVIRVAEAFERDVQVSHHVHHFMKYRNSFVGSEAVDYLVRSNFATDRKHAVFLGQRLLEDLSLFHHVSHSHQFKDSENMFYRFSRKGDCESETSDDSSIVSLSSLISSLQKRNKVIQSQSQSPYSGGNSVSSRSLPPRSSLKGSKQTRNKSRAVTFGSIETRVFERVLDVHPSTTSGPSVALGWIHKDTAATPLPGISDTSGKRRCSEFRLSSKARKSLLSTWGYSRLEMTVAAHCNEKIRERRKKTLNNLSVKTLETESSPSAVCPCRGMQV
eukprot:scaffold5799_cov110-Cylindrotheca_fusiformis.AAC.1